MVGAGSLPPTQHRRPKPPLPFESLGSSSAASPAPPLPRPPPPTRPSNYFCKKACFAPISAEGGQEVGRRGEVDTPGP